jgi:hypothetical protein
MEIHRETKGGIRNGEVKETHPAFGMIGIARVSCTPGQVLFGSAVKHGNFLELTIKEAERNASNSKDWFFARRELIKVAISGTQLGDLLTSMNVGDGVPCTITRFNGEGRPPIEEFSTIQQEAQQQMKEQLDRLFEASKQTLEKAKAVVEKGAPKKADREELLSLLTQLSYGIGSNLDFAGRCFDEKVEKMVTQAKGEVETFISSKIYSAGLKALGAQPIVEIED